MKNIFIALLICSHLFTFVSCAWLENKNEERRQRSEAESIVNSWLGKVISIDTTVGFITEKGDSIDADMPDADFRLIRYIGGDDCTSCRMHLHKYNEALRTLSDSAGTEVDFLCIVCPNNLDELRRILKTENRSNLKILVDSRDSLNRLNSFPEVDGLRTFLVDRNNRVLGVGDPAVNPRIMRLYTSILTSDSIRQQRSRPLTNLVMYPAFMKIGRIAAGDSVVGEFHVGNYGDEPFVLDALVPSCECVTAVLSSDTIAPHNEAIMRVVFREDEPIGSFERTVEIIGNIDPGFTLSITGNVVEK